MSTNVAGTRPTLDERLRWTLAALRPDRCQTSLAAVVSVRLGVLFLLVSVSYRLGSVWPGLGVAVIVAPALLRKTRRQLAGVIAANPSMSIRVREARDAAFAAAWLMAWRQYASAALSPLVGPVHLDQIETLRGGYRLRLCLGHGVTPTRLELASEAIAGALAASHVTVERDLHRTDRVALTVIGEDDPLLQPIPRSENPLLRHDPRVLPAITSALDPIPVGMFSSGEQVMLPLYERSLLVGGSPGSGKSVFLQSVAAGVARMDHAQLWLLDPKRVELAPWRPIAARYAVGDGPDAIALLTELRDEMDRRYSAMDAHEATKLKIVPSAEHPLCVLIVDELAFYTQQLAAKESKEFTALLGDLVMRGRAAAIVPVLSLQKPSHDVLPTYIRDLFAFRIAFRCGMTAQSNVILGEGMSQMGADASNIPTTAPGVGFLLGEAERRPIRFRAHFLTAQDVNDLAAAEVRRTAPPQPDGRAMGWLPPGFPVREETLWDQISSRSIAGEPPPEDRP